MTRIAGLDTDLLGDRFAQVIEQYERATEARPEAERKVREAEQSLASARAKDVQALAEAQLAGKKAAPTNEKKATVAWDDAKLMLNASRRAWELARAALVDDVADNFPEYDAKIADALGATESDALDALDALETAMRRLVSLRAHRVWIARPGKGEGTHIMGPNIVSDEVGPLVAQVRDAVTGERPPATQAEWGIPTSTVQDDGYAYKFGSRPTPDEQPTGGVSDHGRLAAGR